MEAADVVIGYHQRTKHHFHRYAQSLGYLDWANQPNPFRRFEGAKVIPLSLHSLEAGPAYDDIFEGGRIETTPPSVDSISTFFQFSLAISAWKQYQSSRWALRINPSSGNLHPTEGYLVCGALPGLDDHGGVFHYAVDEHALEQRTEFPPHTWQGLTAGFPQGVFFVGLTSIHWREAWKYGERAYRYCQHDAGHALAACVLSAAHLGWNCVLLADLSDDQIRALLGLNRTMDFKDAEPEEPDLMMAVWPADQARQVGMSGIPRTIPRAAIELAAKGPWFGRANRLSQEHAEWDIIDAVTIACQKPETRMVIAERMRQRDREESGGKDRPLSRRVTARRIFFQRRSGLDFDRKTSISAQQFYAMLRRTSPSPEAPPWNAIDATYVDLLLYVHRVRHLAPGLYFLLRTNGGDCLTQWKVRTSTGFLWSKPADCPADLPLFLLLEGDVQRLAAQVSCGQEIAGDGCFALSMIAEFEEPLRRIGPWMYRRLHWEAGMIGQVLYLEAEAAGVRATGIGCFFDDPVHSLLGLEGISHQNIYHFTVGGLIEDTRLTTLPPYPKRSKTA